MIKTIELKKVIFTLDIDYLELVDAVGLDYTKRGHDLKVSVYLYYFNDERSYITFRDILDISSGLDLTTNEN